MLMSWIREVRAAVVGVCALALVLAGAMVVAPLLGALILLLRFWPGNQTAVSRFGLALVRRLTHRLRLASLARAIPQAVRTAATVRTEPGAARLRASLAVVALAGLLTGCGGIKIPPELLDCRTLGCPFGGVCTGPAAGSGAFVCEPDTPAPTPTPTQEPDPIPTPAPTPAPECVLAGAPSVPVAGHRNTLGEAVNEAMRQISGYSGGRVVLEMGRQEWQALVAAELRARGLCAGQHTPVTDEIAVARVDSDPREGFHVYADNPSRPGTGTIVWSIGETEASGGAYRGAWYPPEASPAPTPTPTPGPTPSPSACGAPRWESYVDPSSEGSCGFVWGLSVGRQWIDATLKVRKCCAFCQAIGMGTMPDGVSPRCECPLRPEGHEERDACEAEVGAVWSARGGTLVSHPTNRAKSNCEGAGCQVHVRTFSGIYSEWAP